VTLHLCVECADTTIAQAVTAGATVAVPADDMFWGDRYGKVTDPFGHEWSFSTPLSAERHAVAQQKWEEWQAQQKAA
jgi:PhnB protein